MGTWWPAMTCETKESFSMLHDYSNCSHEVIELYNTQMGPSANHIYAYIFAHLYYSICLRKQVRMLPMPWLFKYLSKWLLNVVIISGSTILNVHQIAVKVKGSHNHSLSLNKPLPLKTQITFHSLSQLELNLINWGLYTNGRKLWEANPFNLVSGGELVFAVRLTNNLNELQSKKWNVNLFTNVN